MWINVGVVTDKHRNNNDVVHTRMHNNRLDSVRRIDRQTVKWASVYKFMCHDAQLYEAEMCPAWCLCVRVCVHACGVILMAIVWNVYIDRFLR